MKLTKITGLLLGATVLVPLLGLSQTSLAQDAAAGNDCDRLIAMLQQSGTTNAPTTLDQARTYKSNSDLTACRTALGKMPDTKSTAAASGTAGSNIVVEQSSPTVSIEQPSPTVTVQQAAPTVSVNQGRPEVTVRQPAPVVTIEMPKPEITIRLPKPSVEVAQAAPQVVVNQAKPDVKVVTPPNTANAEPNVNVAEATNPIIHYESEPPQVHINQAQGDPTVKVEQLDRTADSGAASARGPRVSVSQVSGKSVIGPQRQKLGTVKSVILDGQSHAFLIVERVGTAGQGLREQGAKEIAIPAQYVRLDSNEIMIEGLTQAQINNMREYKADPNYRTVAAEEMFPVGRS
jgi:sporulation protein YlmC with PRC-barrel domain